MKPVCPSLVFLLCALLILARALGLHAHHDVADHHAGHHQAVPPAEGAHAHAHPNHGLVSEIAEHHLAAHAAHDVVDAETPDKTTGKLPLGVTIALLCGIVLLLAPSRRVLRYFSLWREHRPRRYWTFFKPLSHAPPAAG